MPSTIPAHVDLRASEIRPRKDKRGVDLVSDALLVEGGLALAAGLLRINA